ncbi:uncharacterized protein DFL_008969 [Arthrobotrys flagrans]|uniref:PIN domain-containing protein n=1 Tax=Arthrobotrys flagrans TaxID=97331 RepID=A0A436ZQN1_ARTFL|nr:hypothetical protein DFL_008969 [Arthrobotrys flagrans]
MGVAKRTRKFGAVKRVLSARDPRLKKNQEKQAALVKRRKEKPDEDVQEIPQVASSLFFQYNEALKPPYSILIDTNFLNHTLQNKLDPITAFLDCLYAKCIPIITDCVMAELEKLGSKYRLALRLARDERFERLKCDHKGTYADDCIVRRCMESKIYIVATNDRDLKRRIRKIPGVPVMSCGRGKYVVERLPDAPEK